MKRFSFYLLVSLLFLSSCGEENQGEYYGDISSSPRGLILTEDDHIGGWGRSQCLLCHAIENIHIYNYSGDPTIDLTAIRQMTTTQGESSCPSCHGDNGAY